LPATVAITIGLIETDTIANAGLSIVARGAVVTTDTHTPGDTHNQNREQPTGRSLDP
jgi:hypothetical protein